MHNDNVEDNDGTRFMTTRTTTINSFTESHVHSRDGDVVLGRPPCRDMSELADVYSTREAQRVLSNVIHGKGSAEVPPSLHLPYGSPPKYGLII